MSNLVPYSSTGLSRYSPISREASRELARVQGQAMIRALRADAEARLADIKIDAVAGLGTSAQQHVATMTAMEIELVKAVPLAANRLEMIGNITAIAATEIVTDAITKLRRI